MPKFLFLFLLFHSALCANKSSFSFIVFWNVGQGQWITAVNPDQCLHYDFGGELKYWPKNKNLLLQLCKYKQNILHLSHPDLDHYALYPLLVKTLPKICWNDIDHATLPLKRVPKKISLCAPENKKLTESKRLYKPTVFSNKNESSQVYHYKSVLIPGDSSQKQEKIWAKTIKKPEGFKFLSLGHHGSRTSSSDVLLKKLSHLKMAVVQARKSRFNHPHKETVQRLKKYHIPLLKTEDWGNTVILF